MYHQQWNATLDYKLPEDSSGRRAVDKQISPILSVLGAHNQMADFMQPGFCHPLGLLVTTDSAYLSVLVVG